MWRIALGEHDSWKIHIAKLTLNCHNSVTCFFDIGSCKESGMVRYNSEQAVAAGFIPVYLAQFVTTRTRFL